MTESLELLRQGDDAFVTTSIDAVVNWGRKYSFFLSPFVTACCGMEFMSAAGPRYDLDRFGAAPPRDRGAAGPDRGKAGALAGFWPPAAD